MDRTRFERLVETAVNALPEELAAKLENIDIVVEDEPTSAQLAKAKLKRGQTLFGLYEGVPLTKRGIHYGLVTPDRITIFQRPIESQYSSDAQITIAVQHVVEHEIAHHFGISDARLKELGR